MDGYLLLDSGEGRKLEQYGEIVLSRPDPEACWPRSLDRQVWEEVHAVFESKGERGTWNIKKEMPESWKTAVGEFVFNISLSPFKHTGVFPEHRENWKYIKSQISKIKSSNPNVKVLNLFGYTGGSTLAAASAGSEVTHVDSSKPSVAIASQNALDSNLGEAKIRWIVEDARKYVAREVKRGSIYQCIILDPPSYGHGVKNEVWKIEEDLLPLLRECKKILDPKNGFLLLNGYAAGYTAGAYAQLVSAVFEIGKERVECGELRIKESNDRGFELPAGIYARFNFGN